MAAAAQLASLATNAALLRRSDSDLNAAALPVAPLPSTAPAASFPGGYVGAPYAPQAPQPHLPPHQPVSSSKALIHALECLQNKIRTMEEQRAAMVREFDDHKTRAAGELAEVRLRETRHQEELAELRRQTGTSEQAALQSWEKAGALDSALSQSREREEQLSQQVKQRDDELLSVREQLARASDAVTVAGDRASEYSARVTQTVGELSAARAELHQSRLETEALRERAVRASRRDVAPSRHLADGGALRWAGDGRARRGRVAGRGGKHISREGTGRAGLGEFAQRASPE